MHNKTTNLLQVACVLGLGVGATFTLAPQIRWLGFMGMGASLATFTSASWLEKRTLLELGQSIEVAQQAAQKLVKDKEDAVAKMKAHNANLQAWASQIDAKAKTDLADLAAKFLALQTDRDMLVGVKAQVEADCLEKIKHYNSEHRRKEQEWYAYHGLLEATVSMLGESHSTEMEALHDRLQAQLEEELEAVQTEFAEREQSYEANWHLARTRYDELINVYKQITDKYPAQMETVEALVQAQMLAIIEERDRMYAQIQRYHDAKRFTGATSSDQNGNRLIDFFQAQGIVCDADHCKGCYEYDEIWVRPRVASLEGLEKFASALSLEFELLEDVVFSREHGCIKAVLRHHSKEKTATSTTIEEREDWVRSLIKKSNHYRISAPTGEGKSVFLDNLLSALQLEHPNLKITLLDPKYPFTKWTNRKPDYRGPEACIGGMEDLGFIIDARFAEATEDVEAGRGIRDFPPHLFAVDELEYLYDFANNPESGDKKDSQARRLTYLMKNGLRLGRGLKNDDMPDGKGLIVTYITQSPLCSRIGFNKSDFSNSTNIWLGPNILMALEQELPTFIPQKQLAYLHKQLNLRQERGDVFIALVYTPRDVFIASLPSQGHYATILSTNSDGCYQNLAVESAVNHSPTASLQLLEGKQYRCFTAKTAAAANPLILGVNSISPGTASCPGCGSFNNRKDGRPKGIQYYRCKEEGCNKRFKVED